MAIFSFFQTVDHLASQFCPPGTLLSYVGSAQFRKFDLKFEKEIIIRSKILELQLLREIFLFFLFVQTQLSPGGGGGEPPYEEYTGMCHELGSYFQEKIPKRVCQFFTKIPERAIISVRNSR